MEYENGKLELEKGNEKWKFKEKLNLRKLTMVLYIHKATVNQSQNQNGSMQQKIFVWSQNFRKKAVDKYFPQFEKIAENLKWPEPIWCNAAKCSLGQGAEVYSALATEQSPDYDIVKRNILKAYELVPEAYRQKFRSYNKYEYQTYVEYAREKEDLFDKWLTSKKIDKNFDIKTIVIVKGIQAVCSLWIEDPFRW